LYIDRISTSEMNYLYKWAMRYDASTLKKKRRKKIMRNKQEREASLRRAIDWPIGAPFEFGKPLSPQEARRHAIEAWENPFAKEEGEKG